MYYVCRVQYVLDRSCFLRFESSTTVAPIHKTAICVEGAQTRIRNFVFRFLYSRVTLKLQAIELILSQSSN